MLIQIERQGKMIKAGSIKGRRWEKNFASHNSFINIQNGTEKAFGLDRAAYTRLRPDFDRFFWYDTDKSQHYTLDREVLDELIASGLVYEWTYRDHGPQWVIPIYFWSIGGEPPRVSPRAAIAARREQGAAIKKKAEELKQPKPSPQLSLL